MCLSWELSELLWVSSLAQDLWRRAEHMSKATHRPQTRVRGKKISPGDERSTISTSSSASAHPFRLRCLVLVGSGGEANLPYFIPTLGKSAAIAIVQSSQFEFLLIHLHLPDAAPSHAGVRCAAGGGGSDVGVLEAGWGSRDFHERMG